VKIYLRAAWWLTEAATKAGKIEAETTATDYELWFPERLTYKFLSSEKKTEKSIGGFEIKYLNNPRKINKVKFPRELLLRRTIPHTQLPPQGIVVMTVDTAYSTKSWADYTVILTSFIYGGRFYIINMVRGRFNEFELPAVIAAAAQKWKPKRIAIEESVGVKWMGRELKREMDKLQISVPVEYVSLGAGSKANSKAVKAKPVVRLLGDERMYFLNSCEGLQEIYSELEKFTGTSDDAHDDIVSALSILAEQFGGYADMGQKIDFASMQYVADKQAAARHDLIYGLGKYRKYNATDADSPTTVFQAENSRMFRDDMDSGGVDPLGDLF
jgi:predicted phage terminase large subunit-like protein